MPAPRLGFLICALSVVGLLLSGCSEKIASQDPKENIVAAWNDYRLGEFKKALLEFEAATTESAPAGANDEMHLQALYGLATTWNLRRPDEDFNQATQFYRKIIALAPTNDLAAWSMLALARMKHLVPVGTEPDYAQARIAYQECIDHFPNHLASEEAFIYQQETFLVKFSPADAATALAALQKFIGDHPKSPNLSPAYALVGQAYYVLGNPVKRLEAKIRANDKEEIDPGNPLQDRAIRYWEIAAIAEFDVGDFNTARKYYRRLLTDYPNDMRCYGAKSALGRMDALEAEFRAKSSNAVIDRIVPDVGRAASPFDAKPTSSTNGLAARPTPRSNGQAFTGTVLR